MQGASAVKILIPDELRTDTRAIMRKYPELYMILYAMSDICHKKYLEYVEEEKTTGRHEVRTRMQQMNKLSNRLHHAGLSCHMIMDPTVLETKRKWPPIE
jgi:hypothetical protein